MQAAQDSQIRANRADEAFMEDQRHMQTQLYAQQDVELTELSKMARGLGDVAQTINVELQGQQKMLDELNADFDASTDKMNFLMRGVGRLLKASSTWQIYLIVGMVLFFVLEVFLIFFT